MMQSADILALGGEDYEKNIFSTINGGRIGDFLRYGQETLWKP